MDDHAADIIYLDIVIVNNNLAHIDSNGLISVIGDHDKFTLFLIRSYNVAFLQLKKVEQLQSQLRTLKAKEATLKKNNIASTRKFAAFHNTLRNAQQSLNHSVLLFEDHFRQSTPRQRASTRVTRYHPR